MYKLSVADGVDNTFCLVYAFAYPLLSFCERQAAVAASKITGYDYHYQFSNGVVMKREDMAQLKKD